MRITFGLHVQQWHGPSAHGRLGNPVLGPAGMLGLLEVHLGLAGPAQANAVRVAAYLACLRKADAPQRFFHASLQVDEVGTAAELLAWRDEWLMGGWNGQAGAAWPARLLDMAAVELEARASVAPGEADRLKAVAARLDERRIPVEEVQLLDAPGSFPWAWQQVLARLPCSDPQALGPRGSGALSQLQAAVVQAVSTGTLPTLRLEDDGSLQVYRATSCQAAEHWLAARCRTGPMDSRLLVCESGGTSIDDTFRAQGLSACGFDARSALRPALQALGLALETMWQPLDAQRTLEFLTHPVGPFSRSARHMLAEAFAEQPGIGGPSWTKALGEIAKRDSHLVERVEFWLDGRRWSRTDGAPLAAAIERVEALSRALRGLMSSESSSGADLGAAISQCEGVRQALNELSVQGATVVRQRLLEQLVAHATNEGSNAYAIAEVGCCQSATSAAACSAEEADEVVWWMPAAPSLPRPLPWVREEVIALAGAGVTLRETARQLRDRTSEWLRPLLAARKRFVLVLPLPSEEEHPTWQLFKQIAPTLKARSIEDEVHARSGCAVAYQPLPALKAQWQLPLSPARQARFPAPTRREFQSFTSLNELFNNPGIAILKDAAQLQASTSLGLDNVARLLGSLAHRLVEMLLISGEAWNWPKERVREWLEPAAEELVRREGVLLLASGAGMQLDSFRRIAFDAILVLLEHLRDAGAEKVECERALRGTLGELALVGKADLLVHLRRGGTVLLDLKWKGSNYFRGSLRDGDYLQLALYAEMLAQELGSPPVAIGYFTFLDATLLTTTAGLFGGNAVVVTPSVLPGDLFASAAKSWEWRVKQWQNGIVDVVDERVVNLKELEVPEGCLPVRLLGPWNGDYAALFGAAE